ncbi:hypothetical protein RclHR1_03930014 [Rhizophagus clarus]|uniref:Uncharacterized protein n=1 Tax=Rhizophagus clarus TaxID=94130 RepID=A0A2Z6RF12_9GLOM|nr:hypothetical protein RclHR1_03930014 [Rhizophagus clarus]
MQLKINHYKDIIVEWIPYNQFIDIKEIAKFDFTTFYSAIWSDGPLIYNNDCYNDDIYDEYKRVPKRVSNEKAILKCLDNSQNNSNELFLDEAGAARTCLINNGNIDRITIYGIFQEPSTKDYIIVIKDCYCAKCGDRYTDLCYKWCKPCQVNYLKQNFANWTSENEIIDEFIQEMQLKIESYKDIIVE